MLFWGLVSGSEPASITLTPSFSIAPLASSLLFFSLPPPMPSPRPPSPSRLPAWLIMADPTCPVWEFSFINTLASHSSTQQFLRAACHSDGLCTICYKTALLIVFGLRNGNNSAVPFFLFPVSNFCKQTVSHLCSGCHSTGFYAFFVWVFFHRPRPFNLSFCLLYTFASAAGLVFSISIPACHPAAPPCLLPCSGAYFEG